MLDDGGTLAVNVNQTLAMPVEVTGVVTGSGNLVVTSALTTDGGNFEGPATVTVANGGTWQIAASSTSVNGGTLVNNGSATIDASAGLYLGSGSTVANVGTMTMLSQSQISGSSVNTTFANTGSLVSSPGPTGTATLAGGSLLVNNTGSIQLASGSLDISSSTLNLDAGTVSGIGSVNDGGVLGVNTNQTLAGLVVTGGTIQLAAGVTLNASSVSGPSGTLQLDAAGPGQFGQLVVGSSADVTNLNLYLSTSYTPGCGTSVTALRSPIILGTLPSVSGSTPSGGTWEVSTTATTAGAFVYCPPPPLAAVQTYGAGSSIDAVNASGYFAEPVNTATGAYSTTEVDGKLAGLGIPFSFTRSYSSDDSTNGPFGTGWTDSMNVVAQQSGGTVTVSDENGQQVVYTQQPDGSYVGPPGTTSALTAVSGGGWLLVRHDQTHLVFNAAGQLISETDRNGIGLTLTHNTAGQLVTVTDYAGRTVSFVYNSAGFLISMTMPLSRTVFYAYNSSNQLTTVTDALGGVTSYGYDSSGRLNSVTDQNGHRVVANTYDASGRVVTQVNALGKSASFSYDAGTQTTTYTDPNGHNWKDIYQGNVLVERIDPLGAVTSYSYDANLNMAAVTDPNGNTTTMSYDGSSNMLSRTSALPSTESWTYDALNDVTSHKDPNGNTTTYTYDARGNLTSEVLPGGATTTYTRDSVTGAVISLTNANGNATSSSYDAAGDLVSVTSPLGEKTTYTYDAAGRTISMVSPRGNATGGVPSANTTTYTYDALDRMVATTDANGSTTTTGFDAVGNKTSLTDPDGHKTTYDYDAANHLLTITAPGSAVTTKSYDNNGNLVSVRDPNGGTTLYTYDADNQKVSSTDPLGRATTWTYDANGNRLTTHDAVGATTTFNYDVLNRLTGISYSDGTPTVSYSYDADGNRTLMTDGTGTTMYTYDGRNRLTQVTHGTDSYSYVYDADSNVTLRVYPDGTNVAATYDKDDRLSSLSAGTVGATYSYNSNGELTTVALPAVNGYSEVAGYDPGGRMTSIADASGTSTLTSYGYTYDSAGNPTIVVQNGETDTYSYDSRNRLTKVCYGTSCSAGSITYTYDAVGNRKSQVTALGTTTYTYDAANELTATTGATSTSYSYDADGRRTAAGTNGYQWNAANELASSSGSGGTINYSYDGAGDRTASKSGTATMAYSYDVNDPLPSLAIERSGSGAELRRYIMGNGLILSVHTNGTDYYVAHDALGSVVGLTSAAGAAETTSRYDPYGGLRSTTKIDPNAPSLPIGFEGQYLDANGLYHLNARQLDPGTGSFVSLDPLVQGPFLPSSSSYLYANDQPTVLVDPSGKSWNPFTWFSLSLPNPFAADQAALSGLDCSGIEDACSYANSSVNSYSAIDQYASGQVLMSFPSPTDVIPFSSEYGAGQTVLGLFSLGDQVDANFAGGSSGYYSSSGRSQISGYGYSNYGPAK